MLSETVGIANVESKDINTARGPGVLYVISDTTGVEYTTFDRDIAVAVAALKGQNALLGYDEVSNTKNDRNGNPKVFINRYLKTVTPEAVNSLVAAAAPVGTPVPPSVATATQVEKLATTGIGIQVASNKDDAIARAVALKAAIDTSVGLQFVDANAAGIVSLAEFYLPWLKGETTGTDDPQPRQQQNDAYANAGDSIPF